MSASSVAAQTLGMLSVVCWSCLYLPQMYENYLRSSTEGLSKKMLLTWTLSGVACVAYFIYKQAIPALAIQFSMMSFGSLLVVGQIFQYNTFRSAGRTDYVKTIAATLALLLFFVGFCVCLLLIFERTKNDIVVAVLGSYLPAFGFALGFVPQIYKTVLTKDGRGYSVGLSLLDSTGCVLATVALFLDGGDRVGCVSYVVIFAFQYFMLLLKCRYPGPLTEVNSHQSFDAAACDALH